MARKRSKRQAHRVQFSEDTFTLGQRLVTSGRYANLDAMCRAFFRIAESMMRMQRDATKALRDAARKPTAREQARSLVAFKTITVGGGRKGRKARR